MDIVTLYGNYSVPYVLSGDKHCTPGWVQTNCPHCGGEWHLGFNKKESFFRCWECGFLPLEETIAALLGITKFEAYKLLKEQGTGRPVVAQVREASLIRTQTVKLPGFRLSEGKPCPHLEYLKKRGFTNNLDWLIQTYDLHGTEVVGDYNFRIIFPIYFDNNLVSYQGRDYTGRSTLRYMACHKSQEIRDHKNCLYAMDLAKGKTVVVVEGVFDAMKLGPGAVATFGTAVKTAQIRLLVERWENRIILFDNAAKTKAEELATILSSFPGKSVVANLNDVKDPGELEVMEAKRVMKILLG